MVFTDHKPIIFDFNQKSEKVSPRRARQLNFIIQYTTDIRHLPGVDNNIADLLSRISKIHIEALNFDEMVMHQQTDAALQSLLSDGKNN